MEEKFRGRILAIAATFLISIGIFFRYQIQDGFYLVFSDTYEGFIELSILEHWNNVFHGRAHWNSVSYFFPDADSLGYNDGYFIYGIFQYIFRSLGFGIVLSGELVNVVVRSIGFFAFYAAARRILRLRWGWALLGAVLFTLSNNAYIHMIHAQLLSVSFAPGLALLAHNSLLALRSGRSRVLLGWGAALIVVYGAWLMTAYYMAWFFAFFTMAFGLAWGAVGGSEQRRNFFAALRHQAVPMAGLAGLLAIALIPFLITYLPKAEFGLHSDREVAAFSPSLFDISHVGTGNLLYGRLDVALHQRLNPGADNFSERTSGFPLILLSLFACSVFTLLRRKQHGPSNPLLRALALATVTSWLLVLHFGPYSAYFLIFHAFPGAKAIRAVARYQTFLAGPVIALACIFLANHARLLPKALLVVLCALLVLEEINTDTVRRIDRPFSEKWLASIPSPPTTCKAFYISRDTPFNYAGPIMDGIYHHSADAMLIAELVHLPTINGFASIIPPGYNLFLPDQPSYPARVRLYAVQNRVESLCSLDLTTLQWNASP